MTPLERYQKHYLIFGYWNDTLLAGLQERSLNPKRVLRASEESLHELEALRDLLNEEMAPRLEPLIAERRRVHQRLQSTTYSHENSLAVLRGLEQQTRLIHREWSWRDAQDHLKDERAH